MFTRRHVRGVFSIAAMAFVWESVVRLGVVSPTLFPPPSRVVMAFIDLLRSGELVRDIWISSWRAMTGLAIGVCSGVVVGLATARIRIVDDFLSPIIEIVRPLPPVAIIPLVIVWLGIGDIAKVCSTAFAVFFPVWINAHSGGRDVPLAYLWAAQSLGIRPFSRFFRIILPSALPFILVGIRSGIAVAFVMVFVAELAGASAGLGYSISAYHLAYRTDRMIADLFVLGGLGAFTDWFITRSFGWFCPWLQMATMR